MIEFLGTLVVYFFGFWALGLILTGIFYKLMGSEYGDWVAAPYGFVVSMIITVAVFVYNHISFTP